MLTTDERNNKITIQVPGKLHTLAPKISAGLDKKKPLHNSPFALAEIDGDFAAFVDVTGEINPGATLAEGSAGK